MVHLPRPSFIEAHTMPVTESGCWIWTGAIQGKGYGYTRFEFRAYKAHRLSWLAHRGAIPAGQLVLHRCDVRSCVNPDHLFLGTHADNMRDMRAKGRTYKGPRLGRRGGNTSPSPRKGMNLPDKQKLSAEQVQEIISGNETQPALASKFCVSESTIRVAKCRYYRLLGLPRIDGRKRR